ncbi:MAG: hypothetical protein ABIJ45_12120 [Candidatus Zixiibacteriota bacterium]
MIKKVVFVLIGLIIVCLIVGYFTRNQIVKSAVETGGEYALGVENNLASANLDFGGASLALNEYRIDNPDGFEKEYFMEIKRGILDIESGSVFKDEVVVDSMILEGLKINFEQIDVRGNYKQILNHIQNLDFGSNSSDDGTDLRMKIKSAVFRDIEVSASLTAMGKQLYDKSFKIENISLSNIGGSTGASVGEITAILIRRLIKEALSQGKDILPDGFDLNLKNAVDDTIENLESDAKDKLKDLGGSLLKGK